MPCVVDDASHMTPINAEEDKPKPSALPGPAQAPEPVNDIRRLFSTQFWNKNEFYRARGWLGCIEI